MLQHALAHARQATQQGRLIDDQQVAAVATREPKPSAAAQSERLVYVWPHLVTIEFMAGILLLLSIIVVSIILQAPLDFSLVMGVLGGIPSTPRALQFQAESLPPGSTWKLVGIGRDQWPLLAATLTLGGNVRVGLEDNFYFASGEMARGSSYLVERAARMCEDVGRQVATVAEAREMLGLSPTPCQVPADYVPDAEEGAFTPDFSALRS